ncbi:MAG: PEP-CTERM sorting domain-containing protein, partial [Bryobacterales bacterium]|nr:PEP-CTERM sorting domain-containing protein [Bryobacterales bacterium]
TNLRFANFLLSCWFHSPSSWCAKFLPGPCDRVTSEVPEPSTLALIVSAVVLIATARLRARR